MSYDYMLMKGDPSGGLETLLDGVPDAIGLVNDVKARLTDLFPGVKWTEGPELPSSFNTMNLSAWLGSGDGPEFHLTVEPDGIVRAVSMSRCPRGEVERVAKELGLVVLDEQSMEIFGG